MYRTSQAVHIPHVTEAARRAPKPTRRSETSYEINEHERRIRPSGLPPHPGEISMDAVILSSQTLTNVNRYSSAYRGTNRNTLQPTVELPEQGRPLMFVDVPNGPVRGHQPTDESGPSSGTATIGLENKYPLGGRVAGVNWWLAGSVDCCGRGGGGGPATSTWPTRPRFRRWRRSTPVPTHTFSSSPSTCPTTGLTQGRRARAKTRSTSWVAPRRCRPSFFPRAKRGPRRGPRSLEAFRIDDPVGADHRTAHPKGPTQAGGYLAPNWRGPGRCSLHRSASSSASRCRICGSAIPS